MTDNKYVGLNTHAQQDKPFLSIRMSFIMELTGILIVEDRLSLLK
jgi:hypothetical protein